MSFEMLKKKKKKNEEEEDIFQTRASKAISKAVSNVLVEQLRGGQ